MATVERAQVLTSVTGALATIVGILFAVLAFLSWRELRDVERRMQQQTERLEGSLEDMVKASQKLMAGYERAIARDYDQAIKLYRQAHDIYPRLYNVYNALGWAYLGKNEVQAAIDAFRAAKKERPQDIESYSDLALAYMRSGDADAAMQEVAESLRRDPAQREYYRDELYAPLRSNPRFREMIGLN